MTRSTKRGATAREARSNGEIKDSRRGERNAQEKIDDPVRPPEASFLYSQKKHLSQWLPSAFHQPGNGMYSRQRMQEGQPAEGHCRL